MNEQKQNISLTPKGLLIAGKVIKWLFIAVCVSVFAWLCLRVIWQRGPASVRRYYMTQTASDASGGEPHVYERNVYNTTELDKPFHATRVLMTRETSGLQISVYFNANSHPELDDGKISFVLASDEGQKLEPVALVSASAVMYRHFRVVFEGVDPDSEEMTLEILHDGKKIDTCIAFLNDGFEREIRLSGAEKRVRNEA